MAVQGDHAQVDNCKKVININVFGQEKLDHVSAERIKAILDECMQRPALLRASAPARRLIFQARERAARTCGARREGKARSYAARRERAIGGMGSSAPFSPPGRPFSFFLSPIGSPVSAAMAPVPFKYIEYHSRCAESVWIRGQAAPPPDPSKAYPESFREIKPGASVRFPDGTGF